MNTDAVIGCDAVDAGADWLRLRTAAGAVRTIPWSAVKLAGMGAGLEANITIRGVTEKVAGLHATHDSLWIVYAEGGFAQAMIEKASPKREAILETFARQLDTRWKGDQLTFSELTNAMFQMPAKVRMPKVIVVMMILVPLVFFLALAVLFFVRAK
ncbi:MAG: hypothetical protein ABSF12_26780 [Bryobacteraceae bacterium]